MLTNNTINAIIHEVNVAHSIDCSQHARYHIAKQCNNMKSEANKTEKKWNELGIWLKHNPDATVDEIQIIREKLNRSEYVRDLRGGFTNGLNS